VRITAFAVLGALVVAGAVLIAVELGNGASSYGAVATKDACTATTSFQGSGLDGTVQRIALSGLYGAACELDTTREELVLSFVPSVSDKPIRWDRPTIERATRSGLLRAIDDARQRGDIGGVTAFLLRQVVERAPLDWLLDKASGLANLLG
jgi:hypothetical protein